jgi:hypothetical protein
MIEIPHLPEVNRMELDEFIKRADELIELGKTALKSEYENGDYSSLDSTQFFAFRSASLSFLLNAFKRDHPYYTDFFQRVQHAEPYNVRDGLGILQGVRGEMAGGWTITVKAIVSAEIFSDFLEQASHLLSADFKDAAAVITGGVLEEHLRQLCLKHGVETEIVKESGDEVPKKADRLNADLCKEGVYNKLDQKSVTGWLDLRNNAAHGKYDQYTIEQVRLMHQGVTDFMARVSI